MTPGPAEWTALLLSLRVAAASMIFAVPLAVLVAWLLARKRFPGRSTLNIVCHVPLVLPPVVTGYVLLLMLGPQTGAGRLIESVFGGGLAFRWTGAALAAAVMAFPVILRPIRVAFESADPGLEQAAATLGAGPWRRFLSITLPLALPGILGGAIVGFAKSLGEFGATITFAANIPGETQTLALAIHSFLEIPDQQAAALRLAVIALIVSVGALAASEWLSARLRRRARGLDAPERSDA